MQINLVLERLPLRREVRRRSSRTKTAFTDRDMFTRQDPIHEEIEDFKPQTALLPVEPEILGPEIKGVFL